jgi:hypothetical protein
VAPNSQVAEFFLDCNLDGMQDAIKKNVKRHLKLVHTVDEPARE